MDITTLPFTNDGSRTITVVFSDQSPTVVARTYFNSIADCWVMELTDTAGTSVYGVVLAAYCPITSGLPIWQLDNGANYVLEMAVSNPADDSLGDTRFAIHLDPADVPEIPNRTGFEWDVSKVLEGA